MHHWNVVLLERRLVAAEVEGGGALVAADEVAPLGARVAHVVVVALPLKVKMCTLITIISYILNFDIIQGSAKRWDLGCVNSHPCGQTEPGGGIHAN